MHSPNERDLLLGSSLRNGRSAKELVKELDDAGIPHENGVPIPAVPMSNVDHPQHYGGEDDPYEVIKVAEAWGFDTNAYLFNVLKYIRRDKGHTLEDLKKARWYLDRLITRLEGRPLGIRQDGSNDV